MSTQPISRRAAEELSREDRSSRTADLIARAHQTDDTDERDELLSSVVVLNLRVADAIAQRYRDRGVAIEDLEQAAAEGLVKAVGRFDPGRDRDLLTYAVPTIRGEVLRYFRDVAWTLRPPRRVQELQWRAARAHDDLATELGREPVAGEVAERLGTSRREYEEALAAYGCFQPTSLDQPLGEDGRMSLGDSLPGTDGDDSVEARVVLAPAVRRLDPGDRRVLYLRFFEGRTQQQIGDQLGVPQTQVSRRLSRILAQLRSTIEEPVPSI